MSTNINDQECDYGFYAKKKELLGAGINCNKLGTTQLILKMSLFHYTKNIIN